MRDIDELLERLRRSDFRSGFRLRAAEVEYLRRKSLPVVLAHAAGFVAARLAPARPPNDGRQTPKRGHPVFVAQHATATCCRGCLSKWHGIAAGTALTEAEQRYIVSVLERWIALQEPAAPEAERGNGQLGLELD